MAKPLAAGLPLGAILTTERVASGMHPGMHGTTFGGGPLACAVAIEFLRVLDGLMSHVREIGEYFRAQLEMLESPASLRPRSSRHGSDARPWNSIQPIPQKPWSRNYCNKAF